MRRWVARWSTRRVTRRVGAISTQRGGRRWTRVFVIMEIVHMTHTRWCGQRAPIRIAACPPLGRGRPRRCGCPCLVEHGGCRRGERGWCGCGWMAESSHVGISLGLRRRPRARPPTYGGLSQRGPGSLPSWCRWRTAWVSGWHVRFRWRPHAYRRCAHARVVLLRGSAVRAGARTSVGEVNSGGFASG